MPIEPPVEIDGGIKVPFKNLKDITRKKKVFLVPMSLDPKFDEDKINEAIQMITDDYTLTWKTDLIKALDFNKYMLMGDDVERKEVPTRGIAPEIGVRVIRGSQNMRETEKLLNELLLEMEEDEKHFISLSHPAEYLYILLYEVKAGKNPRVKIMPNPADPHAGSRVLSTLFNMLDEDVDWDLQPYDSFMLDENNVIFFFTE